MKFNILLLSLYFLCTFLASLTLFHNHYYWYLGSLSNSLVYSIWTLFWTGVAVSCLSKYLKQAKPTQITVVQIIIGLQIFFSVAFVIYAYPLSMPTLDEERFKNSIGGCNLYNAGNTFATYKAEGELKRLYFENISANGYVPVMDRNSVRASDENILYFDEEGQLVDTSQLGDKPSSRYTPYFNQRAVNADQDYYNANKQEIDECIEGTGYANLLN